jgi:succinylglutamate desuccinylase
MEDRIIGRYEGSAPGPLLICIGGMHGNEPAGVAAIEEVFHLLHNEPAVNPGFQYGGVVIGVRGNIAAIRLKQRYIHRDLNRMLLKEELVRIYNCPTELLTPEDREFRDLIMTIEEEKRKYRPNLTLILDLHTTTADGGIFTIAADDEMSLSLAKGLFAPVILGIAKGLKGTTIDFLNHPDQTTYCIVFEAGQHDDPISVHRTTAAIINCMRSIGAVDAKDVDHRHDGLLKRYSTGLPKVSRLIYHYQIRPDEVFDMNPGYENFHMLKKGDVIAKNQHGPIAAPVDGYLLMPKYQTQGNDGFFIVNEDST